MKAKALLNNLARAGFRITVRGDKLRISPSSVPPDLLEEVKAHKPELLAYLRSGADPLALPGFPVADGPYTPYVVPLSPEAVASMQRELLALVEKLADVEGWTEPRRAHLVETIRRQPLAALRDDLTHFRARWKAVEVVQRATEIERNAVAKHNANRKCATCRHMEHHETGVPIRCRHGRELGIKHHAWLDAPETVNPCPHHQARGRS